MLCPRKKTRNDSGGAESGDLPSPCKSLNDVYRPYFVERNGTLILTSAQPVRNFLGRTSVAYRVCERAFWGLFPSEVPAEGLAEAIFKKLGTWNFPSPRGGFEPLSGTSRQEA